MANLEFDRDRAIEIFKYAVWAFNNRVGGFVSVSQPEIVFMPKNFVYGSLEHRLWLFFAAATTRYGQPSYTSMQRFADSIEIDPRLIDPMSDFENVDYHQLLSGVMGFVSANSELGKEGKRRIAGWQRNLATLRDEYDGDPGEVILRAERTREGLIDALANPFYGIASKVAQLAIIWFQDANWLYRQKDWQEIRQFAFMPVDLHVLRLFRQWGIVVKWDTDQHDAVRRVVSDFTVQVCQEERIEHGILSQSIWHCGRAICRNRPQNPNRVGDYCWHNCPFYKYCSCICTGSEYKINGTMNWNRAHPRLVFQFDQPDFKSPS